MTPIEELYLPDNIVDVLKGLCIAQIVLSAIVVLMYCVLHIPIKVKSGLDVGMTMKKISLDVISDTMLWYYLWYLSFTIAGFAYPRYSNIINTIYKIIKFITIRYMFFPPLLLDIIAKNSTARNVLRSVTDRGLQLFLTFLLFIFVSYIYAFIIFFTFQDDFQTSSFNGYAREDCMTMWRCLVATLTYGITGPGGIGK